MLFVAMLHGRQGKSLNRTIDSACCLAKCGYFTFTPAIPIRLLDLITLEYRYDILRYASAYHNGCARGVSLGFVGADPDGITS